jgi:hypothetical protein
MRAESDHLTEDDPRVLQVAREYLAELEAGRKPDRRAYLARYPDLAQALEECLDGIDLAQALRPATHPPQTEYPANPLGDFQILREVGRGGMGVVYEAVQLSLGRRVALKVLPFAATLDAKHLRRFKTEAHAAAQLHHTNIVPVYAIGCERGVHFYAMQLIDGQSLATVIQQLRDDDAGTPDRAGGLTTSEVRAGPTMTHSVSARTSQRSGRARERCRTSAQIAAQVAEALEFAHEAGVVHRDVKPGNLLLDAKGAVWVTDFGLAHVAADVGLTQTGDLVGTLRYMSPEQASGHRVLVDHRTDVYSLGATLYELLTLEPIFPGQDRQTLLHQILNEEPRAPRRIDRSIPVDLETIVLKAVAKNPAERYATAGEMAADLRRFLDDQPIRARRPTLRDWAVKWARRHRRVLAAAVLGLMAAVLVLAVTAWRVSRAESETRAAYEQLKKEQMRTDEVLEQEATQRLLAEANYRQARKVLGFVTRLGVEELADKPQFQGLRRRLLAELLTYYQEFIDQHGDEPSVAAELIEARFEVAEVLDGLGRKAESLAAYERAMRDHHQYAGEPAPPHSGPPRGVAPFFLLGQPAVREDLKLSADQEKRVVALLDFGPRPPTEEGVETAKMALVGVLRADQTERLREIDRQLRGPLDLLDHETASALGLTDRQKEEIRTILARAPAGPGRPGGPGGPGRRPGPGGPDRRSGPGGPDRRPGHGGPEVDWKQVNEQVLQVLTPDQRARWQRMLGEPFRGHIRPGTPFGPKGPDRGSKGPPGPKGPPS